MILYFVITRLNLVIGFQDLSELRRFFSISKGNSAVSIPTPYGLDGPGIESRWGKNFPHPFRPVLGPTQPPIQWLQGRFPGGKASGGVALNTHPQLAPRLKKDYSYASTPPLSLHDLF